jgi:hypothetical protein
LHVREVAGNFFLNRFEHVGTHGGALEWLHDKGFLRYLGLQVSNAVCRNRVFDLGVVAGNGVVDVELLGAQFGFGGEGTARFFMCLLINGDVGFVGALQFFGLLILGLLLNLMFQLHISQT